MIDSPTTVRPGEELDLDSLAAYLHDHLPSAGLEIPGDAALAVEQFPSGWSNLTYLLSFGPHELVLRRPPFGNVVRSAHDMGREFRVLSGLAPVWPLAPRPHLHCDDEAVIGAPFYVMQRVRGLILRRELPEGFSLPPERARALSEAAIDGLAALHGVDYAAAGLADLGRPEGYAERQVEGWVKRYFGAKTDEHPAMEAVAGELRRAVTDVHPGESDAALVHNDYKYDNLVLDPEEPTTIRAVLDWEMATIGDPMFDLGTTLGYWVEAGDPAELRAFAMGPTTAPGSLTRRQLAERYAAATGAPLDHLAFHHAFGLFKLAVIVQQIYARFAAGKTEDPRFAGLDRAVGMLGEVSRAALAGRLG